ncbi:hypothetical protein DFS34DRAFT_601022 [Phlyctochytrium arcticum]|nr:hypothetical protein DFS34DRAFT_638065 [Phlyctochytrium arcticum]KAI9105812.1 hypothetical protein DFS34DRAFT_601022 [Phlyctochytrium arcticum]
MAHHIKRTAGLLAAAMKASSKIKMDRKGKRRKGHLFFFRMQVVLLYVCLCVMCIMMLSPFADASRLGRYKLRARQVGQAIAAAEPVVTRVSEQQQPLPTVIGTSAPSSALFTPTLSPSQQVPAPSATSNNNSPVPTISNVVSNRVPVPTNEPTTPPTSPSTPAASPEPLISSVNTPLPSVVVTPTEPVPTNTPIAQVPSVTLPVTTPAVVVPSPSISISGTPTAIGVAPTPSQQISSPSAAIQTPQPSSIAAGAGATTPLKTLLAPQTRTQTDIVPTSTSNPEPVIQPISSQSLTTRAITALSLCASCVFIAAVSIYVFRKWKLKPSGQFRRRMSGSGLLHPSNNTKEWLALSSNSKSGTLTSIETSTSSVGGRSDSLSHPTMGSTLPYRSHQHPMPVLLHHQNSASPFQQQHQRFPTIDPCPPSFPAAYSYGTPPRSPSPPLPPLPLQVADIGGGSPYPH